MAFHDKSEIFELLKRHLDRHPWLNVAQLICELQVGFDALLQQDRWEPIKDLSRFSDEELLLRLKQLGRRASDPVPAQ